MSDKEAKPALVRITRGTTQKFGIGLSWDLEYKDVVFELANWYIAIGLRLRRAR